MVSRMPLPVNGQENLRVDSSLLVSGSSAKHQMRQDSNLRWLLSQRFWGFSRTSLEKHHLLSSGWPWKLVMSLPPSLSDALIFSSKSWQEGVCAKVWHTHNYHIEVSLHSFLFEIVPDADANIHVERSMCLGIPVMWSASLKPVFL